MTEEAEIAISQIDPILAEYKSSIQVYDYGTDISDELIPPLLAKAEAAIERLAPVGSSYRKSIERSFSQYGVARNMVLGDAMGILEALRMDYEDGNLASLPALIHGELFSDFLDMASHLLENNYKDAAAVITGSTLEAHLRQLAGSFELSIEDERNRPLRAERLNEDLAKAGAFDKNDQKSITAWLGIRNEAAHGNYDAYEEGQVKVMVDAIREFVRRRPA